MVNCQKCGRFTGHKKHVCPTKEDYRKIFDNPEYRKKLSERTKEQWKTNLPVDKEILREHMRKVGKRTGRINGKTSASKMSKIAKENNWVKHFRLDEKDIFEKSLKRRIAGLLKRPTTLEQHMIEFIRQHNLPYKYVGDGSLLIGFKNPDFINTNGQKIVIETANRFHHQGDWEKERKEHFAKYGFDCIVLFADMVGKHWKFDINNKELLKLMM